MSKFYTYSAWEDTFKPIKNSISKYPDILHFETYGEEQEFVQKADNKYIWTEVDGEGGTYIVAGYHYVNRIHYYITTNPWTDEFTEVPTWMEKQCDCQELLDIDLESPVYCRECEDTDGYIQIPCETVADLVQVYGPEAEIIGE